jgi:DNA-binding GntR family transcriptional regulator
VSRTSLREALRQLEGDGLVTTIPYKGIVVSSMTPEEARQVYQVRAVIEGLAGRLFAEQATASQGTQLTTAMQAIEAALAEGDLAHLVEAKAHFYHVLLSGCGNHQAMLVLQSLYDRIAFLRTLTLTQPGRATESVAEMRQILAAILARDGRQAEQACIHHVERAAAVAATVLHQRESEPLSPHEEALP